jgi:hypothetical protein
VCQSKQVGQVTVIARDRFNGGSEQNFFCSLPGTIAQQLGVEHDVVRKALLLLQGISWRFVGRLQIMLAEFAR